MIAGVFTGFLLGLIFLGIFVFSIIVFVFAKRVRTKAEALMQERLQPTQGINTTGTSNTRF